MAGIAGYHIDFKPLKKQRLLLNYLLKQDVDEILWGGAAGSGKSYIAAYLAVHYCVHYPGTHVALISDTKDNIMETVGSKIFKIAPKELLDPESGLKRKMWHSKRGSQYSDEFLYYTNPAWNSKITYSYLNKDFTGKIEQAHQGKAYQVVIFDESTKLPPQGLDYVIGSRVRPNPDHPNNKNIPIKKIFFSNSGGLATQWHKDRFINRWNVEKVKQNTEYPIWEVTVKDPRTGLDVRNPDGTIYKIRRAYIPAKITDNPFFVNSPYHFDLMQLPKAEREFKLNGNWDYTPGKFFDDFRSTRHMASANRIEEILENYKGNQSNVWIIAIDYGGLNHEFVYQFWFHNTEDKLSICFKSEGILELSDEEIAKKIIDDIKIFAKEYGWTKLPALVMPHDCFIRKNNVIRNDIGEVLGETTAELYEKLLGIVPMQASKNKKEGWRKLNRFFRKVNKGADELKESSDTIESDTILISEECYKLERQLNSIQSNSNDTDDIAKYQTDDHADAARYFAISLDAAINLFYNIKEIKKEQKSPRELDKEKLIKLSKLNYKYGDVHEDDMYGYPDDENEQGYNFLENNIY